MLIHHKINACGCKLNDLCIAVMLTHCNNNAIRGKMNDMDMCIALMLTHCTNNANRCKINDMCVAMMRIHGTKIY